ncbi:glycosyltransferase N-terminal domain-containing protein [uncultured Flavobacterium sp.]|uniref:3-deoxy-D-manno-octulosonic acid transferase n=1 Tax=uncultured Flavobacterium sp. TaxID=165435 RepID=UPI0030CA4CA2
MFIVYNFITFLASQILEVMALFNPKIKLFVEGRKDVLAQIENKIKPLDKTIWFHAASLGEYEQGLPVIEKIKDQFPLHKIVLTFFSPSGYEVRKKNEIADVTVYLPLDTLSNAQKFIKKVHPEMVFFIKYEYWPNYLNELKKAGIKTYLISGIFRENQTFFKWYGSFYRNALHTFDYFYVQNEHSKKLLQSIGFSNVKISGDTRFDRVLSILERDNTLVFIEKFKNNKTTVVIGSSWPKDEKLLTDYINTAPDDIKFILAPHNIVPEHIKELQKSLKKNTLLFSEINGIDTNTLSNYQIFIIDSVGILTKIYSYADIAYVGGGFGKSGIHNILEPATFGVPIVIGKNYTNFAEAIALVHMGGCMSISNYDELKETLNLLIQNKDERYEKGLICSTFVQMNKGASTIILNQIQS